MTLAEWLKQERDALGLSQRDLARESGVPKSMVALLESSKANVQNVTLQRLRQVVAALGISLLETYKVAGLLDTEDEADRDAIEAALLIRELPPTDRAALLKSLRGKG